MYNLSIIIPHYNSIPSLEKLLNSIPTKNDIQIIVVDDKSTVGIDKLNSVIRKYQKGNIIFLKNKTDLKGAGVCRNIGLEVAEGKWILFADADDYFINNFYSVVSSFFETDYDVVFFKPTSIEIDTGKKSDRHVQYEKIIENYKKTKSLKAETYLRYDFVVPWSKLIKRETIIKHNIKFDETLASNDVMFSTKLGHIMEKFCVSDEIIYCVTRNKGSLTMNLNKRIYFDRLSVFIEYYNYLSQRLTKEQMDYLNINGRWLIINAFKYKLPFKKIVSIFILLKKNKIKLFELKLLNPYIFLKRTWYFFKRYQHQKKYLIEK